MRLLSRLLSNRKRTSNDPVPCPPSRLGLEALEDRTLPASVFVLPVSQPTNNVTTFHTLQEALPAAGSGGTVTIEPGAVADFNTDITQNSLTIQGDLNVPSSILPAYNLSIDASGVTLKNLNLNFVSISAGFNSTSIFRSTVASIFIQGGPSFNGNNLISQNVITSSVTITGNTTLGAATGDRITNNTFTGFADTMLSVSADNGAVIQGNTFMGGGAVATNSTGTSVPGSPQTAVAINGGVNVLVANNSITLPGNTTPAGVPGTFQGITVTKFDATTAGLPAGTATAAPVVKVMNNAIATGRGTGLAIAAVPTATGDRDTQVLVQGNDFHNNAVGVSYTGVGGGSISTDLGAGILGSIGGNNFRGFTAPGAAGAAAIVLSNVAAGAQLSARSNLFPGDGQTAAGVVFASAGTIDVSSPLSNKQAFVQVLYNDFLGRSATVGELNNWVNVLNAGGQAAAVQGVFHSTASLDRIVDGFYLKYLGRASDAGGRDYWVARIQGGASLESIQAGFISSAEFISSNNSDYVQGLYRTFFNRTGSASELAFWYNQLQQPNGLNIVANGFAVSAENRQSFVQSIFRNDFHRAGTAAELAYFANQSGDLLAVATQMLDTSEFFNKG
jgi:Domain of unknown function (DUF4214)